MGVVQFSALVPDRSVVDSRLASVLSRLALTPASIRICIYFHGLDDLFSLL